MFDRPFIVSIAGLDPSSGAGLTADVKTFESIRCYGLSVCTANTVQNDIRMESCYWTEPEIMFRQIHLLFERFEINFVKVGIIENWSVLGELTTLLHQLNPDIKIILDPILSSSSKFDFHLSDGNILDKVLSDIYLITPNHNEIQRLYPDLSLEKTIDRITSHTNLLLKGGHQPENIGLDELIMTNQQRLTFEPSHTNFSPKHGSGCILSSAIASYMSLGNTLERSCELGKRYIEKALESSTQLLAYHSS